jgi:hypothetical protein
LQAALIFKNNFGELEDELEFDDDDDVRVGDSLSTPKIINYLKNLIRCGRIKFHHNYSQQLQSPTKLPKLASFSNFS